MLSNLARRLVEAASWRRLGLLFVVYAGLVFALSSAEGRIKQRSGGLGVPDLMQGFTADELYGRFEAFGAEGRRIYAFAELVDMVYPLVYASFFALLLALAARALLPAASRLRTLCLLPYAATLFDYLENACFFTVLLAWPARLSGVATAAGLFNLGKWGCFAPTLLLALLGLAGMAIKGLRGLGAAGQPR
jgi:hypothetical protein